MSKMIEKINIRPLSWVKNLNNINMYVDFWINKNTPTKMQANPPTEIEAYTMNEVAQHIIIR